MCIGLPAHCLGMEKLPLQESLLNLPFLEEYLTKVHLRSKKKKKLPQVKLRPIA